MMAPLSRATAIASGSRLLGLSNGDHDPPPSTMAAQLINNISTINKPSKPANEDDLQKLMAEVSEFENNHTESDDADINVQRKHKLIYVLGRAVLEKLTQDDPFMNVPQEVSHASDALEIFMNTIRETPSVLKYKLRLDEHLQTRGQEPLWIWLFPKVLPLLGRRECEPLTEKIKDFFYVSFQAVARSPRLWDLSSMFFLYMKECAATLLDHLQKPRVFPTTSRLEIMLPSQNIETFLMFDEESNPTHFLWQCFYQINTMAHAISHLTNLMAMLVDISMEAATTYDATTAFQDYLAWIMDAFLCIHELQKRQREYLNEQQPTSELEQLSFSAVQALVSTAGKFMSPMVLQKGYVILSILLADILDRPMDLAGDEIRTTISSGLLILAGACKIDSYARQLVSSKLSSVVTITIGDETACKTFGLDFKKAVTLFCHSLHITPLGATDRDLVENFQNATLNTECGRLGLHLTTNNELGDIDAPPSKRRKVSEPESLLDTLVSDLYYVLGRQKATDLHGLSQVAEESFSALDDMNRCKVIKYLSIIPCAVRGTLIVTGSQADSFENTRCTICDGMNPVDTSMPLPELDSRQQSISDEALIVFEKLVQSPSLLESRRPRVLALFGLRRFVVHQNSSSFLDLDSSPLGRWCGKSLNSSVRELRVAAGRTITYFLQDNSNFTEIVQKNRVNFMSYLQKLTQENSVHLQETCILAWGQVGRAVKDEGLVFVLLGLVKYLGYANPVVSGVAFNEILGLAKAKGVSVARMFSPFWDAIAFDTVKDLIVRPQTTQYMADLLVISVSNFLLLTQTQSLPYLVLTKNYDVIKRISQARQEDESFRVCAETTNLVAILALLLQQNVPDMEEFVMLLLRGVSDRFNSEDLTDMIKIEPSSTAFHLLVAAGEADAGKKSRIRFALSTLASRAPTSSMQALKKGNIIGMFLEQHVLGLVARFSDLIVDPRSEQSMIERVRYVKAVEELVEVVQSHVRIARPHLCVCLQSAISIKGLQSAAFSAWQSMLRNLGSDDVEAMLETTFSIIIQHWDIFDEKTKSHAKETLQYLFRDRLRLLRNTIVNLPSFDAISALAEIDEVLQSLRTPTDKGNAFHIFSRRLRNENSGVVFQALTELREYLRLNQSFLQASAVSEQPDVVVGLLVRSILDTCVKFNESHHNIAQLSAECIGIIGCLDPNRVEAVREQREMIVASNFHDPDETTDFVLFLLQDIIVPAFLSTTDTMLQGFFSFVMQQLLEACDFRRVCGEILRAGALDSQNPLYLKWQTLPETVQDTLTPFLSSKYSIKDMERPVYEYPIFRPDNTRTEKLYNSWLRAFVLDLLQKPYNQSTVAIYKPLTRAVRIRDVSVASFILPYLVLHIILEGNDEQRRQIGEELLCILNYEAPVETKAVRREDLKLCVEAVFRVLDYLSRWIQKRQSQSSRTQESTKKSIELIRSVVGIIPAEIMSQRAVEGKSFHRALFYWEQHLRQCRTQSAPSPALLEKLQEIYTQIDEPDGIEGISAHLHVLDIEQQVLAHRKAGRWTAAQSWYEIKFAEQPEDLDTQVSLLTCLKESGQHDVLLNYVEGMHNTTKTVSRLLPFATEASWATGRWGALQKYINMATQDSDDDFNIQIGRALLSLQQDKGSTQNFKPIVKSLRTKIACSLSTPMTASLASSHDSMLKLHIITELEMIAGTDRENTTDRTNILDSLNRRLEVMGAYLNDKQYLLGIRRAAMKLSSLQFTQGDIAGSWLTSARLARKGNAIHQSFNAVLHASQLQDDSAKIEHARLLWKEGHHRKAIQSLDGAIKSNAFISHNTGMQDISLTEINSTEQQNLLTARANLLLAKWQDDAGQTQSNALRMQYQIAAQAHMHWEKGHYYLGRHYNKLLESEKLLPLDLQGDIFLYGDHLRCVVESYLRALSNGTKYLYQTLPRIITLWLELATQTQSANLLDMKSGGFTKEFCTRVNGLRKKNLESVHTRFTKYISKLPSYMFYTALPQILSRIAHPDTEAQRLLIQIIVKVVTSYPQHSLWNLLAVCTSKQPERRAKGLTALHTLQNSKKCGSAVLDIRGLIKNGNKLTEQLLYACTAGDFQGNRTTWVKLSKDLSFNHKACTPSQMTVPFESVLKATLPTLTDNVITHKAFSRDVVTISSFDEEVMILSSLQKPRKLTAVGSDGRRYGLMCKPKDDLRKDQRLMEFNSMINRALKKDAEASRRQLYIKTYAVTPLNEECGLIEWVDGLKTLRDILLAQYKAIGVTPAYREIEALCEQALNLDDKNNLIFFTDKVLGMFPPVFHKWFVQQFPEPSAWFTARLRYTRSCAVMSMVGTILGLGDRHGENILFEEGNGGTFHVDFNCLFDKGLSFVKPERVPFRLTHNMVDAMGIYGYEGPFRKSSELTLKLLRQHEETLMTILEAFVYDPTLDLLAKKPDKKKKENSQPVQTPQGVLDTIQRKVKGHLAKETMPLGIEGQVDVLIEQATNPTYLAGMYIGWCAFL